jgi:hypothetical protein
MNKWDDQEHWVERIEYMLEGVEKSLKQDNGYNAECYMAEARKAIEHLKYLQQKAK